MIGWSIVLSLAAVAVWWFLSGRFFEWSGRVIDRIMQRCDDDQLSKHEQEGWD